LQANKKHVINFPHEIEIIWGILFFCNLLFANLAEGLGGKNNEKIKRRRKKRTNLYFVLMKKLMKPLSEVKLKSV